MENVRTTWRTPPQPVPDESICEICEADVVVVGAGSAGSCAARAAAEEGASVIVLEQQESAEDHRFLGGGEIGHINSKWQKSKGVPEVDIRDFMNDWQMRTNNRSNYRLIRRYAENCGDCFDWLIEPLGPEVAASIQPRRFPRSENYQGVLNGFRTWGASAVMGSEILSTALKTCHKIAKEHGAKFFYDMYGEQLVRENGRVRGVIACDSEGNHYKVIAKKGVILSAGDYSANVDMCRDLLTEQVDLLDEDATVSGAGWDGSGIRMGVWAGGRLEPRSHQSSPFAFPATEVIGMTATLRVNKYGRRYSNEGYAYPQNGYPGALQPNGMLWAIFDQAIAEHVTYQALGGLAFDYSSGERMDMLKTGLKNARHTGKEGYAWKTSVHLKEQKVYCGETIEELASFIFEDESSQKVFVKSFNRYNELCANGDDEDFGKDSRLMLPLKSPPYYACGMEKSTGGRRGFAVNLNLHYVTLGGLLTDENQNVIDRDFEPIPGLYATGSCCGGRFGLQYTASVCGQSLSICQTLGREAGRTVARL